MGHMKIAGRAARTAAIHRPKPRIMACDDDPIVPPPSSIDVDYEPKPVLYLSESVALVRRIGF